MLGACLLCLLATTAHAATQGKLGYSSTATIDLTLTITSLIRVSGAQDITLSAEQGESVEGMTPLCVSGTSGTEYAIAVQGGSSAGDFVMQSGEGSLSYDVMYSDADGTVDMRPSVDVVGRALATDLECSDGANAQLTVAVDGTDSSTASPGVYSDVLTVMVSPQ